jgi:type III pantothenate kinase
MTPVEHSNSTIVAVDIGNTSTHMAVFGMGQSPVPARLGPVCRWNSEWEADDLVDHVEGVAGSAKNRCWAIASVNSHREDEFNTWLAEHYPRESMQHLRRDQIGIAANLRHVERVGIDRLLGAAAAVSQPPFHVPKIIVDAGTAITVDLVDAEGVFQGGAILAGMRATTKALSEFAEKLSEVSKIPISVDRPQIIGKTTQEALAAGLYWGTVGAVRETIQQMTRTLEIAPTVITTGGDAEHLPIPGEWIADLVLIGIAQVGVKLFTAER